MANLQATEDGVPQGASLSPLLANVYLHYVLDEWFERDVKPRMKGEAYLIRFADDFICCFERESDARRYQSVLPKRLARYSLSVAEEKTKLIRFGRFARRDHQRQGEGAPATFDFLGFTHYCGRSSSGQVQTEEENVGEETSGEANRDASLVPSSALDSGRRDVASPERETSRSLSVLRYQ